MTNSSEMMTYLRSRMRMLRGEYTASDRRKMVHETDRCQLCGRKRGDEFIFGPTNYIKKRIKFRVYLDVHVIEGGCEKARKIIICNGCHLGYHLFNRLSEDAEFGVRISKTVYRRCRVCGELSCRCCKDCGKAPKWCLCEEKR